MSLTPGFSKPWPACEQYDDIEQVAWQIFVVTKAATRTEYAAIFTQSAYSATLFRMAGGTGPHAVHLETHQNPTALVRSR
jgi:hypothetical protein